MRGRKKSGGWLSQLGMVGMGAVILTAALFVTGIFAVLHRPDYWPAAGRIARIKMVRH